MSDKTLRASLYFLGAVTVLYVPGDAGEGRRRGQPRGRFRPGDGAGRAGRRLAHPGRTHRPGRCHSPGEGRGRLDRERLRGRLGRGRALPARRGRGRGQVGGGHQPRQSRAHGGDRRGSLDHDHRWHRDGPAWQQREPLSHRLRTPSRGRRGEPDRGGPARRRDAVALRLAQQGDGTRRHGGRGEHPGDAERDDHRLRTPGLDLDGWAARRSNKSRCATCSRNSRACARAPSPRRMRRCRKRRTAPFRHWTRTATRSPPCCWRSRRAISGRSRRRVPTSSKSRPSEPTVSPRSHPERADRGPGGRQGARHEPEPHLRRHRRRLGGGGRNGRLHPRDRGAPRAHAGSRTGLRPAPRNPDVPAAEGRAAAGGRHLREALRILRRHRGRRLAGARRAVLGGRRVGVHVVALPHARRAHQPLGTDLAPHGRI